jgi:phosphatidate cytidylyltransferase
VTLSGARSTFKRELLLRVVSAVALAALAVGATIYSPWSFLILVVVGGGLVAWEWGRLTRGNGFDSTALIAAVNVAALAICIALGRPDYGFLLTAATAGAILLSATGSQSRLWAVGGLAYAALPAAALVWIRSDQALGAVAVIYLFALAWTTDTAAYVGGRLIGGPKLAPRISPLKTWSGFFAGVITPLLVGLVFATVLQGSVWWLALVSIGLALACQAGDLLESWVKRQFGAKDMSGLIPGHGGLLDRIDGLLLAAVLAAVIALRDPTAPGHGLLVW